MSYSELPGRLGHRQERSSRYTANGCQYVGMPEPYKTSPRRLSGGLSWSKVRVRRRATSERPFLGVKGALLKQRVRAAPA